MPPCYCSPTPGERVPRNRGPRLAPPPQLQHPEVHPQWGNDLDNVVRTTTTTPSSRCSGTGPSGTRFNMPLDLPGSTSLSESHCGDGSWKESQCTKVGIATMDTLTSW